MDSQKKQCTEDKSVMCQNVVCENVDNYFQCVAGANPLYLPPEQDIEERLTVPNFPIIADPKNNGPEQEFKHFNHAIEEKVSPDEVPGKALRRGLATVNGDTKNQTSTSVSSMMGAVKSNPVVPSGEQDQEMALMIKGIKSGLMLDNKKVSGRKKTVKENEVILQSLANQTVDIEYGKTKARLYVPKQSSLKMKKEWGYLVLYPQTGSFSIVSISASEMLVIDVGDWRFGKISGGVQVSLKDEDVRVHNTSGAIYVRRDQLLAPSQTIKVPMEFIVSKQYGITYAAKDSPRQPEVEFLFEKPTSGPLAKTGERTLASSGPSSPLEGCVYPSGQANQCAWKCFGGKGRNCENSETTQCMRFTCSVGGQWKLPTRVSGKECNSQEVKVDSCI